MAHSKNDQRLFDYIHSIGPAMGYKGSLCILNNNGPNAGADSHYWCFLKGGISFEIHREKNDSDKWEYWLDMHWGGPFEANTSTDIIAALLWLKHEFPREVFT